jgi:AcrR family transcriptional regulator
MTRHAENAEEGQKVPGKSKAPVPRLRPAQRRAQILERATDYFAEYGLSAQTRAIADACGVAQRLLYRYFPSKAALMAAVYDEAILAPFKAVWLAQLKDRSQPMNERLTHFYSDYFSVVLTRKWLRLFMHASLSDVGMAPNYINAIIKQMLLVIVEETAAEQKVELPRDPDHVLEIGWILHGAVSHFAIRRHLYNASKTLPETNVTALHIVSFLTGFGPACAAARDLEAREAGARIFIPTD